MSDAISNIMTSTHAEAVLVALVFLAILFLLAAKNGVFFVNRAGVRIGKQEKDIRVLLLKEVDFTKRFVIAKLQELCAIHKNQYVQFDYFHVVLIFEKVLDEFLVWILVNNLSDDVDFIREKQSAMYEVFSAQIGEMNKDLRADSDYMALILEFTNDFVAEFLKKIVSLKKKYEK